MISVLKAAACVAALALAARSETAAPVRHRVYAHLMNPREHPDDNRRAVRPPDWSTFDNRVQFTALRGFRIEKNQLMGFREDIDKYTRQFDLGNVIWPSYPVLFTGNLGELANEIRDRKLYLFDIWGYVPGSGPGGYWQQYQPPDGAFKLLESTLGDRWLGVDVGEQDGRYIGGYASQMFPVLAGRFEQYLNFHRHFERMTNDLGSRMATLVSLNFGHYLLKEGLYTLIGAETAQGLPNGQVYYSFIRGAGKQYGVPWFGNASVWNRWGWKTYGESGNDHGPTKGTSLSLLKRLMYTHVLYNSMLAGFESSWFEQDRLSPVGTIQQAAHRWTRENQQLGVMVTPIALLIDFQAGWTFPRHLYSGQVYRVWGNLPYGPGDYLTDDLLEMLYPRYRDSSYFHDETGFLTETPYGDSADVLLSDAPRWLLDRYPLLVVAGELNRSAEVRDKLQSYAEAGGHLFITAGNVAKYPEGLAGVVAGMPAVQITDTSKESGSFDILPLQLPPSAKMIESASNQPLVVEVPLGNGIITVFTSPFGLPPASALRTPIKSEIDATLPTPWPMLKQIRQTLDRAFREQTLFEVGEGLGYVVCRKSAGEYTIGITNNSWRERPFQIQSHCGPIVSVNEIPLDQSEKGQPGYMPESVKMDPGSSGPHTIAGGDVRIFSVRVREDGVEEIPHLVPPTAPAGRILPLRSERSIEEEILRRPEFFQHFDGVTVDWKYLRDRESAALARESGWIARQKLRVMVDLTSGLNLYPDLRLIDNLQSDYDASMRTIDDLLAKMQVLGSRDLILSLHRMPENNFTDEQSWAAFAATLKRICQRAEASGITLYLRVMPGKPPAGPEAARSFVARVGAPNLRLALSMALAGKTTVQPGIWMNTGGAVAATNGIPIVLDGIYDSLDDEYRAISVIESTARGGR